MVGRAALLIVENHLRRRAAHLDLRAHFLQGRSKRFNGPGVEIERIKTKCRVLGATFKASRFRGRGSFSGDSAVASLCPVGGETSYLSALESEKFLTKVLHRL